MKKPLVVVLAGGEGKRFQPLVTNKTLIPFLGKPLLQHICEMIQRTGYEEILVITNKENDSFTKNLRLNGVIVHTAKQTKPLGMADAILAVEEKIKNRPIIVVNGVDMVDDTLLQELLQQSQKAYAVIAGIILKQYAPVGYLQIKGDRAVSIVEKPGKGKEPSNIGELVFHYFSKPEEFLSLLKTIRTDNDDLYEQALNTLMQKHTVSFLLYEGYWQKLKYSHFVLDMMELFLTHKVNKYQSKSAQISPAAVLEGEVYVDEGAKIQDYAVIKGPAYIGKNVMIGNHTLVRNSMIEEQSVVGFGTEVARSYVGPRCMLHHAFAGDSVLESDVNLSYGTCTANLRLNNQPVVMKLINNRIDTGRNKLGAVIAKGVFTGVQTLLLPGATIGSYARTYPGAIVHTALASKAILSCRQEQQIKLVE